MDYTLKEWVRYWLRTYKILSVKPSTYDSYINNYVKHIKCKKRLKKLKNDDIQAIISKMSAKGYASSTIKHVLTLIRQSLVKARQLGLIKDLSCLEDLEMPPKKATAVTAFTAHEMCKIRANLDSFVYGDMILFIICTGCRVGEAIALHWADVNLFASTVTIRYTDYHGELQPVKTSAGQRTIPIYGDLKRMFVRRARTADKSKRVFLSTIGTDVKYTSLRDAWRRYLARLGLEGGLHKLRHSFAHNAIRQGVPVKVVSAWLGHADVGITLRIYDCVTPDDMVSAAETLSAAERAAAL